MKKFLIIFILISQTLLGGALANIIRSKAIQQAISESISYEHGLACAAIFQDEAPYLREWIEYYKLLGATHFYLYNNLSTDNYEEVLSPYVASGEVELVEWLYESSNEQEWLEIQKGAYNDALAKATSQVKWLVVCDLDEFFVPKNVDTLTEFLKQFELQSDVGGITGKWVMFGTSWVEKIPDNKLMIETLAMSASNYHVNSKSIIRPERVSKIDHVHGPTGEGYKLGRKTFEIPTSALQVNHYWSRDEWYLENIKIPRRSKWTTDAGKCRLWAESFNQDTSLGSSILRFVPTLRQRMGLE